MTQPSARLTLITAARLLDGTGAAAVEQAALLIDGDRVADLGRASHVHVADGASVERRDYGAAWVNPTLYVMKAGIERQREVREREGRLTPELTAQLDAARRALDVRVDAVRRMSEAGVRMTAGSDSPWGWYAPGEFVHEIHMLAQAGLSYADAVVAGTAGAAESIGVGTLAGRLARGRPADALVVRGDPTRDITAL